MRFDVVIGNPPYQSNDGGGDGNSAIPIYSEFVELAFKLSNQYIAMIIPARWYCGGKGLDSFRQFMLEDARIKKVVHFENSREIFPTVKIPGGVCYFLIDKKYRGNTDISVTTHTGLKLESSYDISKLDILIRDGIIRKVIDKLPRYNTFDNYVSERRPYGIDSAAFKNDTKGIFSTTRSQEKNIEIIGVIGNKREIRYCSELDIPVKRESIYKYKIFVPKALDNSENILKSRLRPFIANPMTACTETYIEIGELETLEEAENLVKYINTGFFHSIMVNCMSGHNVSKKCFRYIPYLDESMLSVEEKDICAKYSLTEFEAEHIRKYSRGL